MTRSHTTYRHGSYLYTVKRSQLAGASAAFAIFVYIPRSKSWVKLPGFPYYPTNDEAERKLNELARLNRWELCLPSGAAIKKNVPDSGTGKEIR